jgi:hypothetical protein
VRRLSLHIKRGTGIAACWFMGLALIFGAVAVVLAAAAELIALLGGSGLSVALSHIVLPAAVFSIVTGAIVPPLFVRCCCNPLRDCQLVVASVDWQP